MAAVAAAAAAAAACDSNAVRVPTEVTCRNTITRDSIHLGALGKVEEIDLWRDVARRAQKLRQHIAISDRSKSEVGEFDVYITLCIDQQQVLRFEIPSMKIKPVRERNDKRQKGKADPAMGTRS